MSKQIECVCGVLINCHDTILCKLDVINNNPVFKGFLLKTKSFYDVYSLKRALIEKEITHAIILCRNSKNHVHNDFVYLMADGDSTQIIETGAFCLKTSEVVETDKLAHPDFFASSENVEFRIFTQNDFRFSLWQKIKLIFASGLQFLFTPKGTLLVTAFSVVALMVIGYKTYGIQDSISVYVLTTMLPIIPIILQIFTQSDFVANMLKSTLFCGYWLYYSKPYDKSMNTSIPYGFITRLFDIRYSSADGYDLKGKVINAKHPLFEASKVTLDYSNMAKELSGYYEFRFAQLSTAELDKRPEGMVSLKGSRDSISMPITYMSGWFCGRQSHVIGEVSYYRITKERYSLLNKGNYMKTGYKDERFLKALHLGVSGHMGSNTHLAALKMLVKSDRFEYYHSVESTVDALCGHRVSACIMAVCNSLNGPIEKHLELIRKNKLVILKTVCLDIEYVVAKKKSVNGACIKRVVAHNETFKQCRAFIQSMGYEFIEFYKTKSGQVIRNTDSAYIAENLSNSSFDDIAVICSPYAAQLYNLDVIERPMVADNRTVFAYVINLEM